MSNKVDATYHGKPVRQPPTAHTTDHSADRAGGYVERPAGQPGTVRGAFEYPAVHLDPGYIVYWRDGEWLTAPAELANRFEAGAEWESHCNHQHGVPYRLCDTETACTALDRELNSESWAD